MITIIIKHELSRLLKSSQTWIIVALLSAVFGFLFLKHLEAFLSVQNQLANADHPVGLSGYLSVRYLEPMALVFTLLSPLFAMRSFSDEFRQYTYAFWQSAPVSLYALVCGKFLGVFLILTMIALLATSYVMGMQAFVSVDWKLIVSAFMGLALCSSACAACGMYFSSLTQNNLVAVIASLALLLFSWMLGSIDPTTLPLPYVTELSIANHLRGFFQGYLQSSDIAFFLIVTGVFICLTIVRLDSLRHRDL